MLFAQADPFGAGSDPFGGGASPAPVNPFGGGGSEPANPFGGGGGTPANPFGGGGGGAPAPTTLPDSTLAVPTAPANSSYPPEPPPNDLLLVSIAELKPTTPSQLLRAVFSLVNYGAPTEAKRYLARLTDAKPDDATLIALQKEFTSGPFFALSRNPRMQPEGSQFADRVLSLATKALQEPDHLKTLVAQLQDADIVTRSRALAGLENAGPPAIVPMIAALADPDRVPEHRNIAIALVQMKGLSEEPLIAALEAKDPYLRTQAARVLGAMKSQRAAPYLMGPATVASYPEPLRQAAHRALVRILGAAPNPDTAERYLLARATSYFQGETPDVIGADGAIEVWRWDEDQQQAVPVRYPAADASLALASKLARDLHNLAPDNQEYRRIYLLSALEVEKRTQSFDQPLSQGHGGAFEEAAAAGTSAVENLLHHALLGHRTGAALGAIEVLAEIGDEQLLVSTNGEPRTLAQAMRHGDSRVRAAAASAIMRIAPTRDFPGSSDLLGVLTRAVRSTGRRRALIGYPRLRVAQTFAAHLEHSGFDSDFAVTGRSLLAQAFREPDFQLILISDAIDQPELRSVVQQLRRDPRTARIPIGIMCRVINLPQLQRFAEEDPLTLAFPQPFEVDSLAHDAYELTALSGRDWISADERLEQGRQALAHLNTLLESPQRYPFFNLLAVEDGLIAALKSPAYTEAAAKGLGLLATPRAQHALVDAASENGAHPADRKAAAEAFQVAVQRRGLQLTSAQLQSQYDRYEQSRTLPVETQEILGFILDVMESPSRAAADAPSPASLPQGG
ncbi:hypothetical protein Pla8534_50980 [Lignipirellula cremea]|uniref:HEAT repeat protein n=2 Tax=Lignipirellula cremea TaxID=2528010 RepID=A0A518DZJ2_9BACT|nr:hypothetical protein Pla8534_50980 [Lignipirellula cremea]